MWVGGLGVSMNSGRDNAVPCAVPCMIHLITHAPTLGVVAGPLPDGQRHEVADDDQVRHRHAEALWVERFFWGEVRLLLCSSLYVYMYIYVVSPWSVVVIAHIACINYLDGDGHVHKKRPAGQGGQAQGLKARRCRGGWSYRGGAALRGGGAGGEREEVEAVGAVGGWMSLCFGVQKKGERRILRGRPGGANGRT